MDNSLASFAGSAFASSPIKPDAIVTLSTLSVTVGGPDYVVENTHNLATQTIASALGQVTLEMIALPSGLTVPAVLDNETVIADSNLVQSGVSVTTILQSNELGVVTTFPSGFTVNTLLGTATVSVNKTHEVSGVTVNTVLGQVVANISPQEVTFTVPVVLNNVTLLLDSNVAVTGVTVPIVLGTVEAESRFFASQATVNSILGQVVVENTVAVDSLPIAVNLGTIAVFTWADVPDTTDSGNSWADVPDAPANAWTPVDEATNSGGTWADVAGAPANAWTPVDEETNSGDTWTPIT